MAGSQLKQLKEALKKQGLTGQTNTKSKKSIKKAPSDSRRDDKREVLEKIREQFNPFEIKVNKKKTDIDERSQKGLTGRPGISKQIGEDARMAAYEAKKSLKNRTGVFKDRRFGENDKNMTEEEKMLHRFAKERQAQSSKKSMFSLNDDSDDEENEVGLTHFGKAISLKDDFEQEDDLKNGSDDDEDFLKPKKRSRDDDEEAAEEGALEFQHEEPNRKKTKAEVMKEVMAKSKFYKQQRQILREKTEEKIFDLDEEYDDVLAELGSVPKPAAAKAPQFAKVDANGMSYEKSLKELNMERRAVPADRTKTEEEVRKERADKMRELEEARLRRMEGMEDNREKGPDELDDDFWAGSDSEGYVLGQNHIDGEDGEEEEEAGDEDDDEVDEHGVPKKFKQNAEIQCPESHDDFLDILESYKFEETITAANKILTTYAPRLAVGNKEKLGIFTVILFQHILYLSESELIEEEKFAEIQEGLVSLVKTLSQKYNFELTQSLRDKIEEIHERITDTLQGQDEFPRISDLTFFALVGILYSTSDHYHLIVTPTCIVLGEALEQVKYETLNSLVAGIFIAETFLKYQRISKRFAPEVIYFLQKALLSFIDEELESDLITGKADAKFDLPKTLTYNEDSFIKISDLELDNLDTEASKSSIFHKLINVIELALDTWKDKTSLLEISAPFVTILAHFQTKYPDFKPLSQLSLKFTRLLKFAQDERVPLTLQAHKKLSIATFTPKFEENFNPERKSYDENRSRVELSKMNKQIKQERKIALKELRKDSKFEARQQIKEKKEKYAEYHSKMKRIMNTINTVEGAERNEYDREKKLRKSKK